MMRIFLLFSNGSTVPVTLFSNLPFLCQLEKDLHNFIFMFDGIFIGPNDSISSLVIKEGDYIDVFSKKPTPSDEMKKHLLDEGFKVSKFTFLF